MKTLEYRMFLPLLVVVVSLLATTLHAQAPLQSSRILTLDGDDWLIATDADNVGRMEKWWRAPRAGARRTHVPGLLDEVFPDYRGVVWYWCSFKATANPHTDGRNLLRFWSVDYKADVWFNDIFLGTREAGGIPFEFDVTNLLKPGQSNFVSVRVPRPGEARIDDMVLGEVPSRGHGGITDSVQFLMVPPVRIEDLHVRPDAPGGRCDCAIQQYTSGTDYRDRRDRPGRCNP